MTDKPDKTLEDFLDGKSSVSRDYAQLGDVRPPAALDRTILAAARSAVAHEDDATVIRVRHWRKWSIPAALAATMIVAVPLVVRMNDLGFGKPQPVSEVAVATTDNRGTGLERDDDTSIVPLDRADTPAGYARLPETPPAPDLGLEQKQEQIADRLERAMVTTDENSAGREARQTAARERFEQSSQAVVAGEVAPTLPSPEEPFADLAAVSEERDASLATKTRRDPAPARADSSPQIDASTVAAAPYDLWAPENYVFRIVTLYDAGRIYEARQQFGELLIMHPNARLPTDFPLNRRQAIPPQRKIIRDADEWLRSIAILHQDGRVDAARQALARFFERYPDYQLPVWFPLTREDAAPIER